MRHQGVLVRRAVQRRWGRPMRGERGIVGGRRGRLGYREGFWVLIIRTVHGRTLGERRRGRGAAVGGQAGGRSYRTGHQQRGGVMEEGSEEARDFLKLLTDGSDLTGEDADLGRANWKVLGRHSSRFHHCRLNKRSRIAERPVWNMRLTPSRDQMKF